MGKWERNELFRKNVVIVVLMFALVISLLVGTVGWVWYRDAYKTVLKQEVMIGNFFKTIE